LQDENPRKEEVVDNDDCIHGLISGDYQKSPATQIGWVSTESHLEMVTSKQTTWDIITNCGDVPLDIAEKITQWVLGDAFELESLKNRRLDELSQGEQKLILMASALAQCPNVLILDEPTQGLDWATRRRILALLERVCQVFPDELSLIFITHYEDEWIPSLSHVLHLDRGHAVYQGSKSNYDPLKVSKSR
jgi:iron complex transport system ATP-binding protein